MKKAVALQPARPDLHDDLGVLLAQQLQLQDAEKEFRAALQLDPKYESAQLHLGVALLNGGERDQASAALQQAVQLDPEGWNCAVLSWARHSRQRATPAPLCRPYEQAAQLTPNVAAVQTRYGLLLQRSGDPEKAATAFAKVVELTSQ